MIVIILIAIIVKGIVAILTPLSSDFINIVYGATLSIEKMGFAAASPAEGGFWRFLIHYIYRLWLCLPVDHAPIQSIVGSRTTIGKWYFNPTPGSYLLIFMLKSPMLLFDILTGMTLYLLFKIFVPNRSEVSNKILILWLMNPYNTLIIEMHGAFDIIASFFLILSILLIAYGKHALAGFSLGVGTATKLWPSLTFPLFIIYYSKKQEYRSFMKFFLSLLFASVLGILYRIVTPVNRTIEDVFMLGLPDYNFFLGPMIKVGKAIFYPTPLAVLLFLLLLNEFIKLPSEKDLMSLILAEFLIIFAFSYWHPQFIAWISPLLTLDYLVNHENRKKSYFVLFWIVISVITLIVFGFYLSSEGNSFFYYPCFNNEILKSISIFMLKLEVHPLIQKLYIVPLLYVIFSSLCLIYTIHVCRPIILKRLLLCSSAT